MTEELLKKPIYINIKIETKVMARALSKAKQLTGITTNTQLIRHLIWDVGYPE